MSALTPDRLYVEAQMTLASYRTKLEARWAELNKNDEDGIEIPANMIIMVGLIALAVALVAKLTPFGQAAMSKLEMP